MKNVQNFILNWIQVKRTASVISSEPPGRDVNAQLKTVSLKSLKPLSD